MSEAIAASAANFFASRLKAEIAKLRLQIFPGRDPGPRKWLTFISGMIDTAEGYLEDALSPHPTDDVAGLITSAESLCEIAYESLLHASGAEATQIPHQVVAPFHRWVRRLKINSTIFFRAEHSPNYELATFDYRNFVSNLNNPSSSLIQASAEIDWPVMRVTVPGQALGMLPHFAVVSHELGHAIQDQVVIDFTPHSKVIKDCEDRIKDRLKLHGLIYGIDERTSFLQIMNSWFNEFKADAVGHLIAGPAFFFALAGFLELSGRSYGVSPTHPPSDLRRQLLVDQLEVGSPSYADILRSLGMSFSDDVNSPHVPRCPSTDDLFVELQQILDIVSSAICSELVETAKIVANDIYAETRATVLKIDASIVYSPDELQKDIVHYLDAIPLLIPPIEYLDNDSFEAASLAAVLNVGWLILLLRLDQMPITTNVLKNVDVCRMEQLHELLLKAVELSEAKTMWDEQK